MAGCRCEADGSHCRYCTWCDVACSCRLMSVTVPSHHRTAVVAATPHLVLTNYLAIGNVQFCIASFIVALLRVVTFRL